jgi:hypothetical protein
MCGFQNLKDALEVLIIPLVIFGIGAWLPWGLERQKRRVFINLIRREFSEMAPDPKAATTNGRWDKHLKKRFIHEEIFGKPSENRDFILSLPPDLAYTVAQLWIEFEKATKTMEASELAERGARWCGLLKGACTFLDKGKVGTLHRSVYEPWKRLIEEYAAT